MLVFLISTPFLRLSCVHWSAFLEIQLWSKLSFLILITSLSSSCDHGSADILVSRHQRLSGQSHWMPHGSSVSWKSLSAIRPWGLYDRLTTRESCTAFCAITGKWKFVFHTVTPFSRQKPLKSKNKSNTTVWRKKVYHHSLICRCVSPQRRRLSSNQQKNDRQWYRKDTTNLCLLETRKEKANIQAIT